MCPAACSPGLKVTNLGVSHLHHWRCRVQELGSYSPDKHISDTSWKHWEDFQATIQRSLYSSLHSFMNCLWRIWFVEISLSKCSGALYFNRRTVYYNTCSVIILKANVAEEFFKSVFSLHFSLSSVPCTIRGLLSAAERLSLALGLSLHLNPTSTQFH